MDIADAGNAVEALDPLVGIRPQLAFVVVLIAHDSKQYDEAAFQAGADYFVAKRTASGAGILALVEPWWRWLFRSSALTGHGLPGLSAPTAFRARRRSAASSCGLRE